MLLCQSLAGFSVPLIQTSQTCEFIKYRWWLLLGRKNSHQRFVALATFAYGSSQLDPIGILPLTQGLCVCLHLWATFLLKIGTLLSNMYERKGNRSVRDTVPLKRPVAVFQKTRPSCNRVLSLLISACFLNTWPFLSFVHVLFSILLRISSHFCFFSYSLTFKSTAAIMSLIKQRALHKSLCSSVLSAWEKERKKHYAISQSAKEDNSPPPYSFK